MISDAVKQAYLCAKERGWDKIYIAVDIHNTIADSNYKNTMPDILDEAKDAISKINKFFPEIVLILWSSCYEKDYEKYMTYFHNNGMSFAYFNENPEVKNSETGDFSIKFYFNVLVEDKAGFVKSDWKYLLESISKYRCLLIQKDTIFDMAKGLFNTIKQKVT